MNFKNLLLICSIFGALAVVLGAFGAHGLKNVLPIDKLATFKTGVSYNFYHAITLLFVTILLKLSPLKWFKWSAMCFILGIILFSGSLYLLATREVIGLTSYKWLGPITPIGGVFFILGWIFLGMGGLKFNDK